METINYNINYPENLVYQENHGLDYNVKELAEGVYILSFGSNGNKIYTKKFTVKK